MSHVHWNVWFDLVQWREYSSPYAYSLLAPLAKTMTLRWRLEFLKASAMSPEKLWSTIRCTYFAAHSSKSSLSSRIVYSSDLSACKWNKYQFFIHFESTLKKGINTTSFFTIVGCTNSDFQNNASVIALRKDIKAVNLKNYAINEWNLFFSLFGENTINFKEGEGRGR